MWPWPWVYARLIDSFFKSRNEFTVNFLFTHYNLKCKYESLSRAFTIFNFLENSNRECLAVTSSTRRNEMKIVTILSREFSVLVDCQIYWLFISMIWKYRYFSKTSFRTSTLLKINFRKIIIKRRIISWFQSLSHLSCSQYLRLFIL